MLNIKKFNVRLSAVFVSMVVLFVTIFSLSSSTTNAGDITLTYRVCNATTGEFIREYSLTVEGINTRSVFPPGDDDREIDYSKNGVVKLILKAKTTGKSYIGSGFVVDGHTIATAAHCIYDYTIKSILFFDQNGNNCMTITDPVECHYPVNYENDSQYYYYDYALITVKQSLEDYRCFNFGMMTEGFVNKENNVVSASGFPSKVRGKTVNTSNLHELYRGTGRVTGFDNKNTGFVDLIQFNADASGGDSGGPVYVAEHINEQMYYTVIGITVFEQEAYNECTALSPTVLKFLTCNSNKRY